MNLHIAIPHASHLPERRAALAHLLAQLGDVPVTVIGDRLPCWAWSERMWQAGLDSGADHAAVVQDDGLVSPRFVHQVRAFIEAHPREPLALFTPFEACEARGIRSPGVWGTGYVLPREMLADFLEWRRTRPQRIRRMGEDQLLGVWAAVRGLRWLHPLPSLVDRRAAFDVPTTNGHEIVERARLRWDDPSFAPADLESAAWWAAGAVVDREWTWGTPAPIASHVVPRGEVFVCIQPSRGRTPNAEWTKAGRCRILAPAPLQLQDGGRLFVVAPGQPWRLDSEHSNEIALGLRVEELTRSGWHPVIVEDHNGPLPLPLAARLLEYAPAAIAAVGVGR